MTPNKLHEAGFIGHRVERDHRIFRDLMKSFWQLLEMGEPEYTAVVGPFLIAWPG